MSTVYMQSRALRPLHLGVWTITGAAEGIGIVSYAPGGWHPLCGADRARALTLGGDTFALITDLRTCRPPVGRAWLCDHCRVTLTQLTTAATVADYAEVQRAL